MIWAEPFQVASYVIFIAVLLVFYFKGLAKKRKLFEGVFRNDSYEKTKEIVANFLSEKENESSINRFENVITITKRVVIQKLTNSWNKWGLSCAKLSTDWFIWDYIDSLLNYF